MAVEIPVVIDIDGAFKEAAQMVPESMKIMQTAIDKNALSVPVEISKKGDLAWVKDFIGQTELSMDNLKRAIRSATTELSRLKRKGASDEDIQKYQAAVTLLKLIESSWKEADRVARKYGDDQIRNLEITREYEKAIRAASNTVNEINAKLASYTAMVNNSDIGSAKFIEAARNIGTMARKMQEVQDQIKIFGTKTGSIDNLNARLQQVNNQWKQMSAAKKFTSDGKLTAEAAELYRRYKEITAEVKRQGMEMSTILSKEEKRAEVLTKVAQKRAYENGVLNTTVKTISVLEAKVSILQQKLNKTPIGTEKFAKLNEQLRATQREIDAIRTRMNTVDSTFMRVDNTLARMLKKSAYFFGLHTVLRFLRNVREVTAEFELQRVALGGIIQDAEQANLLFRQIKAAAIESPFQIKDLVTYTKQLSAYRVETENLFDVTMKLADVSAGLGVDMNRLILAYGQVKAAAVLRGQELRQFTEAGIPMVELLAKKFTELNGRMVSTAEVFELISKRAVPFKMIEEIFDDMTSAGGKFYKMQEKQAETLAGQWSNLKDALSIMYDEIGNTDDVHKAMSSMINDAKFLMQNWRSVSKILGSVAIALGAVRVASLPLSILTTNTKLAEKATLALARAEQLETLQLEKSKRSREIAIRQLQRYSANMTKASMAQTALGRGWYKFAASMAGGGWITLAATALGVFVGWLYSAWKEANRLNNELEKIGKEGGESITRSVANFQRLANAAVEAADGSDEQSRALEELKRTYSDIIPEQDLQINKLRELKGNYNSLTEAIREKINMQIREQKINAATDYYAGKIQKGRKRAKDLLEGYGLDKDQINAILDEIQRLIDNGTLKMTMSVEERANVMSDAIRRLTGLEVNLYNVVRQGELGQFKKIVETKTFTALSDLIRTYEKLDTETKAIESDMSDSIGTLGEYAKSWENVKNEIKGVSVSEEKFGKSTTFAFKKEKIRKEVEVIAAAIEEAFKDTGIDISDAISPEGKIDFNKVNESAKSVTGKFGLDSYMEKLQKAYEEIVPTEQMVGIVEKRLGDYAKAFGLTMDDVQGYLMRGNQDIEGYVKELQSSLKDAETEVNKLNTIKIDAPSLVDPDKLKKAEAFVSVLQAMVEWLDAFAKKTKTTVRHEQDPFIASLQEKMRFMQDYKKGYDDFKKYLEDDVALSEQSRIMLKRGMALGLSKEEQQRAAGDLSEWYSDMINAAFKQAQDKHGAKGTLDEFLSQEIKGTSDQSKTLREFQKLIQALWDAKTTLDTSEMEKNFEEALKKVSDELKRSETAKNFFSDILSVTGDEDLAQNLTVSVYGDPGSEIGERIKKSIDDAMAAINYDRNSDLGKKLATAAQNMDFREVMKNINDYPKELQDAIRTAASAVEKYNGDMAKSYAKLLMRYDEIEQQRIDIKKKAAQEIETIEKGLTLELMAIDENSRIQDKKAAKEAAEERAKAAKEGILAEKEFELSRLTADYRLFVSSVGVMSEKAARVVANKQKEMLIKMFVDGKISMSKYKKEIRAVNEQLDKYTKRTKDTAAYTQGGISGLMTRMKEDIDSLRSLASTIQTVGGVWNASSSQSGFLKNFDSIVNKGEFANLWGGKGEKSIIEKKANEAAEKAYKKTMDLEMKKVRTQEDIAEARAKANREATKAANKSIQESADDIENFVRGVESFFSEFEQYFYAIASMFEFMQKMHDRDIKELGSDRYQDSFFEERLLGWNRNFVASYEKFKSGDIFGAFYDIGEAVSEAINPTEKWNFLIGKQGVLIENLDYQYGRLEKEIEKAFGSDYIANYNKQLDVLYAKQEAYLEQARLEREKGKKADEDAANGYEKQAREVSDQILDMQGQLAEFFAGTDLTSAATDFATAWIDAYKEFGSTTDAMREKFNDMLESMVTNSLAARVMQNILQPLFQQIDDMAKDGELSANEIAQIAQASPEYIEKINNAMTALMNQLTAAGYNIRQQPGQFTGIKRNIANATEESVNGLTQAMNVNNFYMSHIPGLAANVAQILAIMSGGNAEGANTTASLTFSNELAMQYLSALPNIDQNISEILRYVKSVVSDKSSATNINVVAVRA